MTTIKGSPEANPILEDFLRTDIGRNPADCAGLIAEAARIAAGQVTDAERCGNLYLLSMRPDGASIANLYDDSLVLTLSLEDLTAAIGRWAARIGQD